MALAAASLEKFKFLHEMFYVLGTVNNTHLLTSTLLVLLHSTGFLYDEFFTKHKNPWAPDYPERPERVSEPYKRCCELGLVDRCTKIQVRHIERIKLEKKNDQDNKGLSYL